MIQGLMYRKKPGHDLKQLYDKKHIYNHIARDEIITWSSKSCWLAQFFYEHKPPLGNAEPLQITSWSRLDNREEILARLNIPNEQHKLITDESIILKTFQKYGDTCTNHLFGDFCFAIYDARENTIFCARDHMGVKPFYYYFDEHVFVFSSSLSLFHELNCVPMNPCMDWASKFLIANLSADFEKTAYYNIFKLPPAHQLNITKHGITKKKYFEFHTEKFNLSSSDQYVSLYQEQLERAIKSRIKTNHPLGTESSGGLDSSTVTAYAAKYFTQPLSNFYDLGFSQYEYDKCQILKLSQHCRLPNTYIFNATHDHEFNHKYGLRIIGAPVEHINAITHQPFYEFAKKHHIQTLLSGFGGDEFITTLHADLYLYELFRNKKYLELYSNLPGNGILRAFRLAKFPFKTTTTGGKISRRMQDAFQARWPNMVIREELINFYDIQKKYEKLGEFDHNYSDLDKFTLENRLSPFISTRLENCTLMAASYGIEYRWPLLDPRLIQCFLSIPTSEKYKNGIGRYLHRKAISDVVPGSITWKISKGMGKLINPTYHSNTLNSSLHPDLLTLIDLKKLKQQAKKSRLNIQEIQNIRKVNQLDNWLKYYFRNGCSWKNTPR